MAELCRVQRKSCYQNLNLYKTNVTFINISINHVATFSSLLVLSQPGQDENRNVLRAAELLDVDTETGEQAISVCSRQNYPDHSKF